MSDYILEHHGIKGQKWGIRRFQNYDGTLTAKGRRRLKKTWVKSYNEASEHMNSAVEKINSKYGNKDLGRNFSTKAGQRYIKEIDKEWKSQYVSALKRRSPELFEMGESWVSYAPYMNMYMDYIHN